MSNEVTFEAGISLVNPEACPRSRRVDRPGAHSWQFEGDDPYIRCAFCEQVRDALTGRILDHA